MQTSQLEPLSEIVQYARRRYAELLAGGGAVPWWSAVILTASSESQAERYRQEIRWRVERGTLPHGVLFLVVPDPEGARIGSGGATINALRALAETSPKAEAAPLEDWWGARHVLIIHAGGDSRRLPQYSCSGKLFSALPVKTPWGESGTMFDELLANSTAWAEHLSGGLVVVSGDVLLTFATGGLHWERPGVSGVAIRVPAEVGCKHGVYILGEGGRVYSFLQKPSVADVAKAGGLLPDDTVAVDSGLQCFDPPAAAALSELAGVGYKAGWRFSESIITRGVNGYPAIDLYDHFARGLTGEWTPAPEDPPALQRLAAALKGRPLWCDLVDGEFTHVGTTRLFRQIMTEETTFTRLYEVQHQLGSVAPPGVRSAGVIVDSVLAGGSELGAGAMALECALDVPVRAARGAMLHGLSGLPAPVEVPEHTVIHQVPIALPDGCRGTVIRVYGVEDDPKLNFAAGPAQWLNCDMAESLRQLDIDPEQVWPGVPAEERTLWNARLFPVASPEEAWACARWMLGLESSYTATQWAAAERLSLETSALLADDNALIEARNRRMLARWQQTAVSLVHAGSDVRPLLAQPPGLSALAATGHALTEDAERIVESAPTEAASYYFQAFRFLAQAGLQDEAEEAYTRAYRGVQRAVEAGMPEVVFGAEALQGWRYRQVAVAAPARVDLGGGWSDTPPFCLDWGGTVLNIGLTLNGEYPICANVRRLEEPLVRCIAEDIDARCEFRTAMELQAAPEPGSPFSIPLAALQMLGLPRPGQELPATLAALGGGLEIRMAVNLPLGSGLGTSSILAATVLRALAEMAGIPLTLEQLTDQVLCLEQRMTTGGGWQDQVGGLYPGAKLVASGPGLRQRLRVEPLRLSETRRQEFLDRFVVYYTGIRRIAKDLLAQIVGSYLAREVSTVQVLHSIKTLAAEMAYAMREGEWDYLGQLIRRHWALNQMLDPHTTNAPISALLTEIDPYLSGAKLAGAGGGGFLLLLAHDCASAAKLRDRLAKDDLPGELYTCDFAEDGMQVRVE